MFGLLKNHPFAVEAFFETSLVLTFALPKQQLESLIPSPLQLETFDDKWAFVAMALVQTKHLRPKGFPTFLGNDFYLIGYRVFVKYTSLEGKRLRGLYILKSETDKKQVEFLGNIFTKYAYTTTDIQTVQSAFSTTIQSIKSNFKIEVDESSSNAQLPINSIFSNWKEARRFAGPLPFTFSFDPNKNSILIIEGVRKNWQPVPIEVLNYQIGFLQQDPFKNAVLANAFIIREVPYSWKKGKIEQL
jgi:hypothetical protein